MRTFLACLGMSLLCAVLAVAGQQTVGDDGGWVLALEKAWSRALEEKDTNALDKILEKSFVSVDNDGSVASKGEFLASIKAADYRPSQAVTEESKVQVYGNSAVVVGVLRVKTTEKGKALVRRDRFVDTWIKINGAWQCVATTSTTITAKRPAS